MTRVAKVVLAVLILGVSGACQDSMTGLASDGRSAALTDQPGPGDKQCVPGQNSQPQGGKKAGACSH
jgi:hypothetical protein